MPTSRRRYTYVTYNEAPDVPKRLNAALDEIDADVNTVAVSVSQAVAAVGAVDAKVAGVQSIARTAAEEVRTESQATDAELAAELDNHGARLGAVETLGGLAPGEATDATVANVITNPAGTARTAVDTAVSTFLNTPTSKTGTAVGVAVAGKLTPEQAARRAALRASSHTPVGATTPVALPTTGGLAGTGFTWQTAPLRLYEIGGRYVTDFDPEALYPLPRGATYYVHTTTGSNTNAGTEAAPFATLNKAYTTAAAGDTIVLLDQGTVYRGGGWEGAKITKSVRLKARHPGVVVACADNLTYTATAGTSWTYQAARTNVDRVVDMGVSWAPEGYAYVKLATPMEVDARPGSWAHDGTTVYVHTLDNTPPAGPRILALLLAQHFWAESSGTADVDLYLEGLRIVGGAGGLTVTAGPTYAVRYYAKDCTYSHGTANVEATANAANFAGAAYVYQRRCKAVHSRKDGFNYTAYNVSGVLRDAPRAVEVDCEAYDLGLTGQFGDTCNASTAHVGAKVVRVNSRGHHTRGAVFADVQAGTQSVNYGCTGWDSLSSTAGSRSIFHAQQAGADMWLYGGEGFGADWTLYAVTGAWLGHKGTTYDTTQGGGTIAKL